MKGSRSVTAAGRRLPIGAEVLPEGGVSFRVWAPDHARVEIVLEGEAEGQARGARATTLEAEPDGYFSGVVGTAAAGTLYRFRLDGHPTLYPDLASRFQPDGPHGPSQVIDPSSFAWTDAGWSGVQIEHQVVYEMHIGTFTREGTYAAAAREFEELRRLGITVIEVMPVAEFPGRFGWGYDGVDLFAPTRLYGQPDDLRRFVDRAHAHGLAVILDVVYNHVGPDGAFFRAFAEAYFTDRHANDWGEALNFDGAGSAGVRDFFLANAAHWIAEYHMDGLRLDATQSIHDSSPDHILAAIGRRAREAAGARSVILIAENEAQEAIIATPTAKGGYGLDAVWNDDFHHSAIVALTGRNEAYYSDFLGTPQELLSTVKHGYLYQGQWYSWWKRPRGQAAWDVPPAGFVVYLENHDHVASWPHGLRLHQLTSPGRYRAMTALCLLAPGTPMLFQGQEFASSRPFVFFADHQGELRDAVRKGRFAFLAQFPRSASDAMQAELPDPSLPETFERCRLDLSEREEHRWAYDLHKDLLRLRLEDPALAAQRPGGVDGAVLAPGALVLRFFAPTGHEGDRLLLVNLGCDLLLSQVPEPLLAAPSGCAWRIAWASEEPRYGGGGVPPVVTDSGFLIPGETAVVLSAHRS